MDFYFDLFDEHSIPVLAPPRPPPPPRPATSTYVRRKPNPTLDVASMPIFPPSIPPPYCIASNDISSHLSASSTYPLPPPHRTPLSTIQHNVPPPITSSSKTVRKPKKPVQSTTKQPNSKKPPPPSKPSPAPFQQSTSTSVHHHALPPVPARQVEPSPRISAPPPPPQQPASPTSSHSSFSNQNPHLTSDGVYLAPDYLLNPAGPASSSDTDFKCPNCDKVYKGKHARSIWRRHLQDKHGIPLSQQPRRTRWDNDANRPKSEEERRARTLDSKRKWARKNRLEKDSVPPPNNLGFNLVGQGAFSHPQVGGTSGKKRAGNGGGRSRGNSARSFEDDEEGFEDEDEEEEEEDYRVESSRGGRTPAGGRGRNRRSTYNASVGRRTTRGGGDFVEDYGSDEDEEEEFEQQRAPAPRQRQQVSQQSRNQQRDYEDEDDDEEGDGEEGDSSFASIEGGHLALPLPHPSRLHHNPASRLSNPFIQPPPGSAGQYSYGARVYTPGKRQISNLNGGALPPPQHHQGVPPNGYGLPHPPPRQSPYSYPHPSLPQIPGPRTDQSTMPLPPQQQQPQQDYVVDENGYAHPNPHSHSHAAYSHAYHHPLPHHSNPYGAPYHQQSLPIPPPPPPQQQQQQQRSSHPTQAYLPPLPLPTSNGEENPLLPLPLHHQQQQHHQRERRNSSLNPAINSYDPQNQNGQLAAATMITAGQPAPVAMSYYSRINRQQSPNRGESNSRVPNPSLSVDAGGSNDLKSPVKLEQRGGGGGGGKKKEPKKDDAAGLLLALKAGPASPMTSLAPPPLPSTSTATATAAAAALLAVQSPVSAIRGGLPQGGSRSFDYSRGVQEEGDEERREEEEERGTFGTSRPLIEGMSTRSPPPRRFASVQPPPTVSPRKRTRSDSPPSVANNYNYPSIANGGGSEEVGNTSTGAMVAAHVLLTAKKGSSNSTSTTTPGPPSWLPIATPTPGGGAGGGNASLMAGVLAGAGFGGGNKGWRGGEQTLDSSPAVRLSMDPSVGGNRNQRGRAQNEDVMMGGAAAESGKPNEEEVEEGGARTRQRRLVNESSPSRTRKSFGSSSSAATAAPLRRAGSMSSVRAPSASRPIPLHHHYPAGLTSELDDFGLSTSSSSTGAGGGGAYHDPLVEEGDDTEMLSSSTGSRNGRIHETPSHHGASATANNLLPSTSSVSMKPTSSSASSSTSNMKPEEEQDAISALAAHALLQQQRDQREREREQQRRSVPAQPAPVHHHDPFLAGSSSTSTGRLPLEPTSSPPGASFFPMLSSPGRPYQSRLLGLSTAPGPGVLFGTPGGGTETPAKDGIHGEDDEDEDGQEEGGEQERGSAVQGGRRRAPREREESRDSISSFGSSARRWDVSETTTPVNPRTIRNATRGGIVLNREEEGFEVEFEEEGQDLTSSVTRGGGLFESSDREEEDGEEEGEDEEDEDEGRLED